MQLKNKRVLVTGGAGFVGSNLVDALVEHENAVVVLDDLSTGKAENLRDAMAKGKVDLVQGSVLKVDDLKDCLKGIDVVFHLAVQCRRLAVDSPDYVHEVNATGTLRVLEQARQVTGLERFVQVSSADVYGTAMTVPMNEEHPLAPTTVYGASKLAGELYAQAYLRTHNMPVVIVRPFSAYGYRAHHAGTSGELIPRFLVRILNGEPLSVFGEGSQTRDFTFVSDTVQGMIAVAQHDAFIGDRVNLAHGAEASILDVANILRRLLNAEHVPIEKTPARLGDVDRHYADVSKLKSIGFMPSIDIETGLAMYVDWFKKTVPEPVPC